jgi:hypothetical protein
MPTEPTPIEQAIDHHDAQALAKSASPDELSRLKVAEEVLQLARERKKNTSRMAVISNAMVGVVAAVGMLVNAYQSYSNSALQAHQRAVDEGRWNKEFTRAQRADKYRAFFETSVLATDPSNPDKRLVGYALLQEFVDDEDYNSKATLMLEESLSQELRGNNDLGLEGAHRNAVVAIVGALSQSPDCHALERAARSIDRLAQRHASSGDTDESLEVFRIYVRKLMGRAALTCKTMREFSLVRHPLADTLTQVPKLVGATGRPKPAEVNAHLAQMLIDLCKAELENNPLSECTAILERYAVLCDEPGKPADQALEKPACALVKVAAAEAQKAAAPPPPAPAEP